MKIALMTIIFLVTVFAFTCKKTPYDVKYGIEIINASNKRIQVFQSSNYPDTLLPDKNPFLGYIKPSDFRFIDNDRSWEEEIDATLKDTISVFFADYDTLANNEWETVKARYLILKRVDFGVKYLKDNDYKIIFR